MKKYVKFNFALVVIILLTFSLSAQDVKSWKIDKAHSSVNFSVNHFFSAVTGKFREFSGEIHFDPANLKSSKATFNIKVSSIDTDDEKRDKHLQSEDFFDAANYPEIKFVSTRIEKINDKLFNVYGKLSMRKTTKDVVLPLRITGLMDNPWKEGSVIMGIAISTKIDRTDYGIGTGSWAATAVVGDEVRIEINMELDGAK
ncbi:MAG: polyisoprenoid-binding protein [Bacteroidetes bacterium]|nr:MAG: polyisoprenoid-binding protein [Bacteroidota bacterium]REK06465.1 MAG: polyisoprenoid-binding protein [Bacteroidota bacterium]REK33231.1 MAG: polyisoprenoid-binding protein [Bacteroidota bacterium]REK47068.1 MAG: polyisoprenoid-binding protein [Bacteroidota bacterium]